MFRKQVSSLVLLLLLVATAHAQGNEVDQFIRAEMTRQAIPGLSLAVVKNGQVVKVQGYGLANIELNVPVKPETVFKIGSVSKQFIASGIMLLVQQGKIGLDDKISKYLDGTPETWKEISVRHLLTHTSGIVREAPGFDPFKVQNDADVIKTAYERPLRFQPGMKWEYCNVGYFILAEIIHKVTGKPWPDYLSEQIFAPLGMKATRTTTAVAIVPDRAAGYFINTNKLQNADNWPALRPSGAFLSTVLDLAKWEHALYTNHILKQPDREKMWAPVTLNNGSKYAYGFGWELEDMRGISSIRHGGTLAGFRAHFARFPTHGLTIIVLSNLGTANVERIVRGVAPLYIPEIRLDRLQPKTAPDPQMTSLFQTVLKEHADGVKELKQVTPEFVEVLSQVPQSSRAELRGVLEKTKSFDFLWRRDVTADGFLKLGVPVASIWNYRLISPDQNRYYSFYVTADNRLAYLEWNSN